MDLQQPDSVVVDHGREYLSDVSDGKFLLFAAPLYMILTSIEHVDDSDLVVLPDHPVVHGSAVLLPVLRIPVVPGPVGHSVLREPTIMHECLSYLYLLSWEIFCYEICYNLFWRILM